MKLLRRHRSVQWMSFYSLVFFLLPCFRSLPACTSLYRSCSRKNPAPLHRTIGAGQFLAQPCCGDFRAPWVKILKFILFCRRRSFSSCPGVRVCCVVCFFISPPPLFSILSILIRVQSSSTSILRVLSRTVGIRVFWSEWSTSNRFPVDLPSRRYGHKGQHSYYCGLERKESRKKQKPEGRRIVCLPGTAFALISGNSKGEL